jgi:uracil-DNA glycosylase
MTAEPFLPERISLPSLREAARRCRGCPLFLDATQTVFGQGRASARAFFVGEQPGNDEDLAGEPFVGPAGRVLNEALDRVGIRRTDAYVTNAVKHFKWVPKETKRIHKKPSRREVNACKPWLEQELAVIRPEVVVCLGATAAQALLGPAFRVTADHGKVLATEFAGRVVATVHPSSILRQRTEEERLRAMEGFVADLAVVARLLEGEPYSPRRISMGAIRDARRAGSQVAARAAPSIKSGTTTKVTGSRRLTP